MTITFSVGIWRWTEWSRDLCLPHRSSDISWRVGQLLLTCLEWYLFYFYLLIGNHFNQVLYFVAQLHHTAHQYASCICMYFLLLSVDCDLCVVQRCIWTLLTLLTC